MSNVARPRRHSDGGVMQPLAALIMMFLLASLGAVRAWPWWLEYVVLAPPAVWLTVSGHLVMYRQRRPGAKDHRLPVPLVGLVMVPAALQPTRFSGLAVAGAFAIVYLCSYGYPQAPTEKEKVNATTPTAGRCGHED